MRVAYTLEQWRRYSGRITTSDCWASPGAIAHATTLIPCPTDGKLVVTLHDLAFLHDPSQFTRHGVRVFRKSLQQIRERADMVLRCSQATMDDCLTAGIGSDRLRLAPLGVEPTRADGDEIARVRRDHNLPDEYLLFDGTVEPRKNLRRLVAARDLMGADTPPLVVAGAVGLGDIGVDENDGVRFLGYVPHHDLGGLYGGASVVCYPSEREGYGLPVLEAMAHGLARVQRRSWATTAELTAAVYRELVG